MHDMDAIYREYARAVHRYLLSLTHDAQLAEELTQETFYRAVMRVHTFEGRCKMQVWLCQIAKHLWYQHLEKKTRHATVPLQENMVDADDALEDRVVESQTRVQLYQAAHKLEEPYREVFLLRVNGAFTYAEIAEVMDKTENWARVTFYRAKQKVMWRWNHADMQCGEAIVAELCRWAAGR